MSSEEQFGLFAAEAEELSSPARELPAEVVPSANPMDNAVLLVLTFQKPGLARKVSQSNEGVEVQADRAMWALTKRLLQSPAYDAVSRLDSETRSRVEGYALRSVFKGGIYLMPLVLVAEINRYLGIRQAKRAEFVGRVGDEYSLAVEAARVSLGPLFDGDDYPQPGDFVAKFSMSWQFVEFTTPGKLRSISSEIFRVEQLKAEEMMISAVEEARAVLREGFAELVEHMADRLAPGPDGKRKVFRDSLVENFEGFLEVFRARNTVAGDENLARLVEQARDLLAGVSAGRLRSSVMLRERVQAGMAKLKGELDSMVVAKGRRISFGEE